MKGVLVPLWLSLLLVWATIGQAQDPTVPANNEPLVVATYECPPFVIREPDGQWSGLSILLWEAVAAELIQPFEYRELPLEDLLEAAANRVVDVGVACVSITPEREEFVDFSHSIYETHMAIAVAESSIWTTIGNLLTDRETLFWMGMLVLVASLVGGVFYLLEHRINPKLYSRKTVAGKIVEGFILGLLFITRGPVNYYEFQTLAGRVLTVMLAVATTLFVASFTAILASAFTLDRLKSNITGPADLKGNRVGVKAAATSERYLDRMGIGYRTYDTVSEMLDALEAGTLDAVVADDPVLRYEIRSGKTGGRYTRLTVLPYQFERQNYALVLNEDPEFLEGVDRALLEVRDSDVWDEYVGRYLGTSQ